VTKEKIIQEKIHRAMSERRGLCLFRNNSGIARYGNDVVRYGVPPKGGGSDLIEMVGQKIAVFLAIEVKTDAGKLTAAQGNFIEKINAHGGIAGVARSVEEAEILVDGREVD
jgi:hypothetical protein